MLFNIPITVTLCLLLLRPGLGELPEECSIEVAGEAAILIVNRLHQALHDTL